MTQGRPAYARHVKGCVTRAPVRTGRAQPGWYVFCSLSLCGHGFPDHLRWYTPSVVAGRASGAA